jgi:hypothetical protein
VSDDRPGFAPLDAIEAFLARRVRFVVIGGFGAQLLGSSLITGDLDVCYSRDDDNLDRLAAALHDLHAVLRGAPEGVPFLLDAETLKAGDHFTFSTDAGPLDILGHPSGIPGGYEQLERAADAIEIAPGLTVKVASIDDLIRMKRAAGRPKDLIEVEVLGALRDEIDVQAAEERRRRRRARRI